MLRSHRDLALSGFLILYLELALIRWMAAFVPFLSFFTNIVLLAAFLGVSAGCLARASFWRRSLAWIWAGLMAATLGFHRLYRGWAELQLDLAQEDPQVVFFGAEPRIDLASFSVARVQVPIELIVACAFLGVAAAFVGLGQILGRAFDEAPQRLRAYSIHVAGSLAGVLCFSALSAWETEPLVWFAPGFAMLFFLAGERAGRARARGSAMAWSLTLLALFWTGRSHSDAYATHWSPYYRVVHALETDTLSVNGIGHQRMWPLEAEGVGGVYALVHDENQRRGRAPFSRVLVIGAGSGNDVAHALDRGASHVDAVDIDPRLLALGREHHPEAPYSDPRVRVHADDGRHFLRTSRASYDLVVYGLVDSLILASSVADLRLESFLFTREAFEQVRRLVGAEGVFVTLNLFREAWVADRIALQLEDVFGVPPLRVETPEGVTAFLSGPGFEGKSLASRASELRVARDDWPFPYVREPGVPALYLRTATMLALLALGLLRTCAGRFPALRPRMFFLGAGFLLLETRAVVALGLVFGNTWVTASLVLVGLMLWILVANAWVARRPRGGVAKAYLGLLASLALAALWTHVEPSFHGGAWTSTLSWLLALAPIGFAAVIFARSFQASRDPSADLAANIAGAILGGLCEVLSLSLGFSGLLGVVAAFYLLSWPLDRLSR